jgi:hypothetical protein
VPQVKMVVSDENAELAKAFEDVCEWLNINVMRSGQYSVCLAVELACHLVGRGYNVYAIYDEISFLEGSDTRSSRTKTAAQFMRPPLRGLWHKHHFQARFIPKNMNLEMIKPGAIEAVFVPYLGQNVDEFAGRMAHEMVIGALSHRADEQKLTGEFIVYERQENGSNYYFTLGSHGDYKAIRRRVDTYRQIDLGLGFRNPS